MTDKRRAHLLDDRQSRLICRVEFALERCCVCFRRRKEIAVHSPKVAVDIERLLQALDAINGGLLAFAPGACDVFAAQSDKFVKSVVASRSEMRSGARRHSLTDRSAIENNNLFACAGEFICDGHPRDAGANNGNVGAFGIEKSAGTLGDRLVRPI